MKKKFTILLLLVSTLAALTPIQAKQVNSTETDAIAMQVFKKALEADEISYKNNEAVISNSFTKKDGEVPLYTIYNFKPNGFVILSAEDNYNAVIAFSTDNNIDFSTKEKNPVYSNILNTHEQRIKYVKKYNVEATPEIKKEWNELKLQSMSNAKSQVDFEIVVAPLTTTKWGQGEFYNQLLPQDDDADDDKDGRTNGGCVPIAMSQLIKFHNYPPSGNGDISYTDPNYGKLSADFCETNYNWNNMPDELTGYNEDVATVVLHMGLSTETYYSIDYTGTYSSYVRDAFVNHFGFDDSASWFNDVYNDLPWVAREELDAGRPLIVSAGSSTRSASRHCWVVDGYGYLTEATVTQAEYFHMNWGWSGKYNGWYLDNNAFWKPLEEDSRDLSYNVDRRVIYKLFPAEEECQSPKTAYVSTVKDTRLYLYYSNRNLEETTQFRYRKIGDTDWIEFEPTEDRAQYVRDLTPNTRYEYQVKRTCCEGVWSSYGPTEYFKTASEGESCEYVRKSNADDFFELMGYDIDEYNLYRVEYNQDGYDYIYGFRSSCNSDEPTSYYDCFGESVSIGSLGEDVPYTTLSRNRCTVPVTADCANNTGAFFYQECDNGRRFYFIETEDGTIYDPYFPDSLDIEFEEGTVVNFDFEFADFASPCSVATGGAIWFTCIEYNTDINPGGGGNDEIFETYPFLNDLVDPSNCTIEKIEVYDRGSYNYLEIEFANGKVQVYRDNGLLYCTNRPERDYICIEKYRLTDDDILESWACGGTEEEEEEEEEEEDPSCIIDVENDIRVTDRSSTSAYLYVPRPYDRSNNQFRYRAVGTTAWALTDISDKHYKTAKDLTSGTEYEFQLRYECSQDSWSGYSASFYFSFSNLVAKSGQILPPLSKLELNNILEEELIEIYPNPATNSIQITGYKQIESEVELTVTDLTGKTTFNKIYNSNNASISLNIEDLPAGIYLAEIKQANKQLIKKFIKK